MKALQIFNLSGVLLLAGLCLFQWRLDQGLNVEITRLDKIRLEQSEKLKEQTAQLSEVKADLDQFRKRFGEVSEQAEKATSEALDASRKTLLLTAERDQLKESIGNWTAAVTQRDERLKEANERIRKIAGDLAGSVTKFNDLATNYNETVKKFNELSADRNELVTRYNDLVGQVNKSREKDTKN